MSLRGEMGYPTALSAPNWGFNAVYLHDKPLVITHAYASEVIENILFKVAFPAEFHAQTAVECALQLHPLLKDRLDDIDKIMIYTQEPGIRIITKSGPLHNPADRDHCIQYMCAIALIFGQLSAEHYEDHIAKDPRIDAMRAKMIVEENPQFTQDYYDPNKRAISNAMQVFFNDGTTTDLVTVPYPIGHPRRRQEAKPLLRQKFQRSIELRFDNAHCQKILALYDNPEQFNNSQIADFMTMLCVSD